MAKTAPLNAQIVSLAVFAAGQVAYFGTTLLEETSEYIKLRIKKPRTSKYYEQVFPKSQVVSVYGNEGETGGTTAIILSQSAQQGTTVFGTLEVVDGEYRVTDSNGYIARVKPAPGLEIVITADDSNPAPAQDKEGGAPVPPAV